MSEAIDWKARAEAAEAQVAKMRDAALPLVESYENYTWERNTKHSCGGSDSEDDLSRAMRQTLSDTTATAEAYEKRIKAEAAAEERRKVYVEESNRLNAAINALEEGWRGMRKNESYFGHHHQLLDQRDYFAEQLAALDAPGATAATERQNTPEVANSKG